MEDYLTVKLRPNKELELWKYPYLRNQAFVGAFNGHGGKEAAKYARERSWVSIHTVLAAFAHIPLPLFQAVWPSQTCLSADPLAYCTK